MAIRLSYSPITPALELAEQAGRGDDFRFRFAAERQLQDQLARDYAQRMQTALAYDQLAQREREGQAARQQRGLEFDVERQFAERQFEQRMAADREDAKRQAYEFDRMLPVQQMRVETERQRVQQQAQPRPVDPLEHPAFEASRAMYRSKKDQLDAVERQIDAITQRGVMGTEAVEGQEQRWAELRAQRQRIAGEMGAIAAQQEQYLQGTLPEFEAAQQVAGAAEQTREAVSQADRVVREVEADLPPDASTDQIIDAVMMRTPQPQTMEDAQRIADIVNAVEARLRGR